MTYVSAHVRRFRDALLDTTIKRLSIDTCKPPIDGIHGILTTTKLQYCDWTAQLLSREHEYLFWIPEQAPLEVSLQLYQNANDHWRLFAYCKGGMLLSINLTTMKKHDGIVTLSQTMKLATRSMTKEERERNAEQLCQVLRGIGCEVDQRRRLVLGTFNGRHGEFIDTWPATFIREFVMATVLKGHFMANKGYTLPGLKVPAKGRLRSSAKSANKRSIPLGLRFEVLERDDGKCKLCGRSAQDGARLHVDHITPWSHGSWTLSDNLQTLCDKCNLGKGNRSTRRYGKH